MTLLVTLFRVVYAIIKIEVLSYIYEHVTNRDRAATINLTLFETSAQLKHELIYDDYIMCDCSDD